MEKEAKHLLEEQELIVGQAPHWTERILGAFPAFAHANYRLFFVGQLTSLVGTWIHIVALGWLVLEVTNSAFWVSLVHSLATLPILLFSLPAGMLADRLKRRKLLVWTQIAAMTIVFSLGLLVQLNLASLALILLLTFLLGTALAIEMPTRQTLVFDVVGKRDIASAVALNVAMFNGARIIGPALSGFLIAAFNIQAAFFLNAVSFLAIIVALRKMKLARFVPTTMQESVFSQMREGLTFSFGHPVIRILLLVVAFNSLVPWTYGHIMPVVARQIFSTDSFGFGIMLSAAGIGALLAAILVSVFGERLRVGETIGIFGVVGGIVLFLLSMTSNFVFALMLLMMLGFSLLTQMAITNATIQRAAPDSIRGRVMSVYALMFLGLMPIGGILIGIIANTFGAAEALRVFGIVTLVGTICYLLFLQPRLKGV